MGSLNISLTQTVTTDVFGISDYAIFLFTWTVYGVICQLINIFGMVTNIINIICFVKQGFQDSVNVSLVGLAVSDICSLATLCLTNLCFTPAVSSVNWDFEPMEVNYLVSAMPHLTFIRVSTWITAIITLERCLCVIAPLKIRIIFTPMRTSAIISCVFVISFVSLVPMYVVNRLDVKFSPLRNRTIFGLVFTPEKNNVEMITIAINSFVLPFVAFIIIVACTATLVVKLKSATKWRTKSADQSQSENISNRNQKISRMVVMISILFIVCFVPISISMLAIAFEPEFSINGKYLKLLIIIGGLGATLESINSSVNIFIYYYMSSRYREVFHKLF